MAQISDQNYEIVIIGGGFYGCCIALFLRQSFENIVIIEKEPDLLTRASFANQARVHNGYHYPRNIITALRSSINFPRFVWEFRKCIDDGFTKVYAIALNNSKVNAYQFKQVCGRINTPIKKAPQEIIELFDTSQIEEVYCVQEYAFNANKLRQIIKKQLETKKISYLLSTEVDKVIPENNQCVGVLLNDGSKIIGNHAFACTYSQINTILHKSKIPLLPLKHELAEIVLIEVPDHLKNIGITIMDGPFFSMMPFPPMKIHSLSHVRYTPHLSWQDLDQMRDPHQYLKDLSIRSHQVFMLKDAERYVPSMKYAKYGQSLYEIKTVLTHNEIDDGRPILFRKDYGLPNFSVVMGGKIDNIYDIIDALKRFKDYSRNVQSNILFEEDLIS